MRNSILSLLQFSKTLKIVVENIPKSSKPLSNRYKKYHAIKELTNAQNLNRNKNLPAIAIQVATIVEQSTSINSNEGMQQHW